MNKHTDLQVLQAQWEQAAARAAALVQHNHAVPAELENESLSEAAGLRLRTNLRSGNRIKYITSAHHCTVSGG